MTDLQTTFPLTQAHLQALRDSSLLRNLAPPLREELIGLGCLHTWKRGGYLLEEGSPIRHFSLLLNGKAREYYCDGTGTEYLRRLARPGCYIGLHSALGDQTHYSHRCQAMTGVTAFAWPTSPFVGYLVRHPDIGLAVSAILAEYFEHSCRKNCLCRKPGARCRVAGYLLSRMCSDCGQRCSHHSPGTHAHHLDLWPLAHAAEDINLSREAFSRALVTLQKEGILLFDNSKVTILDLEALKRWSGVD